MMVAGAMKPENLFVKYKHQVQVRQPPNGWHVMVLYHCLLHPLQVSSMDLKRVISGMLVEEAHQASQGTQYP